MQKLDVESLERELQSLALDNPILHRCLQEASHRHLSNSHRNLLCAVPSNQILRSAMKQERNRMEKLSIQRKKGEKPPNLEKKPNESQAKTEKYPCIRYAVCGGYTKVIQSRSAVQSKQEPDRWIKPRYRECLNCGYKFWTQETVRKPE